MELDETGFIESSDFERYLDYFLQDNPHEDCPKAGHSAYADAVRYRSSDSGNVPTASYFMTYHTILKTSKDYIEAMEEARALSDNLTITLNEG